MPLHRLVCSDLSWKIWFALSMPLNIGKAARKVRMWMKRYYILLEHTFQFNWKFLFLSFLKIFFRFFNLKTSYSTKKTQLYKETIHRPQREVYYSAHSFRCWPYVWDTVKINLVKPLVNSVIANSWLKGQKGPCASQNLLVNSRSQ